MARFSGVMDRVDLQGGQRNNAYIYRDPQKGGKWHLYFLNRETNKNHRFVLKRSDGGYPDPSAAGENEALGLAQELKCAGCRGPIRNAKCVEKAVFDAGRFGRVARRIGRRRRRRRLVG